MNRRQFIGIAGSTVLAAGTTGYLFSDKSNLSRTDLPSQVTKNDFSKNR